MGAKVGPVRNFRPGEVSSRFGRRVPPTLSASIRNVISRLEQSRGRRRSRAIFGVLAALSGIVISGCSRDAPMNYLKPVGPDAVHADRLWDQTFAIAVVVFFLVEGGLLFVLYKYRQRSAEDSPKQVHGNTKLEVLWTLIPTLILGIVVAPPTVQGIFRMSEEPADALKIDVVGHQWFWEYKYSNGIVTANEMHIPINTPVSLSLTSRDVIHSFWVPKLAGKQDAVPGRISHLNIEAPRPGEYFGECTEYCGLSHANMRLKVFAHTQEDYEDWVRSHREQPAPADAGLAAAGQQIFMNGAPRPGGEPTQSCASCHAISGTPAQGITGPNLTDFANRTTFAAGMYDRTDKNLRAWLDDPPARKPGARMPDLGLKPDEILQLVAYLNTLE